MVKALLFAACLLLVAVPAPPLAARDTGQYAQTDPRLQDWFRSRKDNFGVSCCDTADGTRVDDPDWECTDQDHCRVKLDDGNWYDVPERALLRDQAGPGFAIVWRILDPVTGWFIRCFQPGSRA